MNTCLSLLRKHLHYGVFVLLLLITPTIVGEELTPVSQSQPLFVPSTDTPVNIDAVLDDAAWESALMIPLPFEVRPGENIPAPVRTECLITYDRKTLYIAFRCFDPDPSLIRTWYKDHDTILQDDCVGVTLDTFNDERRAYDFFVSPLGVQFDAIDHAEGTDVGWDAVWDSAGKIYEWGYAVEMAIPFNQMRFQRTEGGPQVWGFDADRRWPRTLSHVIASSARDRNNACYLCQLLKVKGFENIEQGTTLEITPTLTAIRAEKRIPFPEGDMNVDHEDVSVGTTLQWAVTPNMTVMGAVNPDFSQIEADSLQLDINEPFTLYYAEKRPFFVEGSDYFNLPVMAVYTRTIHDPDWGLKLAGKTGDSTLGFYLVRDETLNFIIPGSQFSSFHSFDQEATAGIFRFKYDVGADHSLGLLLTDRESGDYFNRVCGIDGFFRLSATDYLKMVALGSSTRYGQELATVLGQSPDKQDDYLVLMNYQHFSRNVRFNLMYKDLGSQLRTDLGYIPQVDYRQLFSMLSYGWIAEPGTWWSNFICGINANYTEDQSGELLNKYAELFLEYSGALQSNMSFAASRSTKRHLERDYDLDLFFLMINAKPLMNLDFSLSTRIGDAIDYQNNQDGSSVSLDGAVAFRLGRHLSVETGHIYEEMTVDAGRLYTANVTQSKITVQFTARTFLRAIVFHVDYDYATEHYQEDIDPRYRKFFSQLLYSYKFNPRTVLFIGYSDNAYDDDENRLLRADRTFFFKIGYHASWTVGPRQ